MSGVKKSGLELDRKMLAELAVHEPDAFRAVCDRAHAAIAV